MFAAALHLCPCARAAENVSFPEDLSKWIVTDPPTLGSDRWYAANHSDTEWVVSISNDRVAVAPRDFQPTRSPLPFNPREGRAQDALGGEQFVAKVEDGWVVGFNAGEFGAGLWWFAPDGERRYKISENQVSGFIHSTAGLLALEGLAHLTLSRGQIIRVTRGKDRRWKASRFVDLQHAPETAFQEADGSILVATTDRLVRVHLDQKMDVLLSDTFWGGLYPRSMVRDSSGVMYLGMRHGVARITPQKKGFSIKWLLPNEAFVDAKPKA